MNKQPEALRLAEHLELHELHVLKRQAGALCHAAAELRRLHEENERLREAVGAEREACAKVCEARVIGDHNREDQEAKRCAAAIRARGET